MGIGELALIGGYHFDPVEMEFYNPRNPVIIFPFKESPIVERLGCVNRGFIWRACWLVRGETETGAFNRLYFGEKIGLQGAIELTKKVLQN